MNKYALILIGSGTMALAISLVMGWVGFPHMIRGFIRKNSRLQNGTSTYEMWTESRAPLYLKFRFFNVLNPEQIEGGGKPIVAEVGPYTYLEKKVKLDIGPGEMNGTVQYRQQVWLYFVPELSAGKEEDLLTFINVPFVGMAKTLTSLTPEPTLHKMINENLTEAGESLFKSGTVRALLFDGLSLAPYLQLMKVVEGMMGNGSLDEIKLPAAFQIGKFAIYYGKNGSDDGIYEVDPGVKDWKAVGQIRRWNSMETLPWWKSDECNKLQGTDGSIFPSSITKESQLTTFSPELCRSQTLTFESDVEFKGYQLLRFTPSANISQGIKTNPKNECYCTEKYGAARVAELCERDGFIRLAGCTDGSPISMSAPHFYGLGEPSTATGAGGGGGGGGISGLTPEQEKHQTHLDIEPWTGLILRAAKRLQMNVELERYESMPAFSKVQNLAFPLMWVEESGEAPDDLLNTFGYFYTGLDIIATGKYVLIGISSAFLGLGILLGICTKDKDEQLIK